jgi:molybdenum cofactor cytidylyltransferase
MPISSIVLSAGSSDRMGSPKALLKIGDHTFLQHIIDILLGKEIEHIIVVLGAFAEDIKPSMTDLPVTILVNEEWENGQLSSLVTGLRAIDDGKTDGVLVWPVDHPLVSGILIDELLNAFENDHEKIIIPKYNGRRGHPVIFPNKTFHELRSASPDEGARSVVHHSESIVYEVETKEEAILLNIDTPDDFLKYIKR